jgi:LPS sulfotransferase NodH
MAGGDPVFVCGMARSGTTWLANSLGESHELAYVQEAWLVEKLAELADWFTMVHAEWGGWTPWEASGIDRPAFVASLGRWYRELLERAAGGGRVIEKTPDWNVRFLPFLRELFPDGRFVCLHRDGRNVVASVEARRTANQRPFDFERECERWAEGMDVFAEARGGEGVVFVRYEDLVADFDPVFAGVCEAVGIEPFVPPTYTANTAFRDMTGGYNDRWRAWPLERKETFNRIAGRQLTEWGYSG